MDCSTPGFPVHHQLPVYSNSRPLSQWCIQPSHPLSSPSPPTFNLYQHQGLFKWVSSSHQVAKVLRVSVSTSVLPISIQDLFPLGWTGWISSQSKERSRVFSNTTVQKHQFFGAQLFWLLFDYYSFKISFDIWQSKSSLMTFSFPKFSWFSYIHTSKFVIISITPSSSSFPILSRLVHWFAIALHLENNSERIGTNRIDTNVFESSYHSFVFITNIFLYSLEKIYAFLHLCPLRFINFYVISHLISPKIGKWEGCLL